MTIQRKTPFQNATLDFIVNRLDRVDFSVDSSHTDTWSEEETECGRDASRRR